MAETSGIEWTDATWNPIRGCTKISPGCAHCYAEMLSKRNPAVLGEWGLNGVRVVAAEKSWGDPVRWAKRHRARVLAGEVEARSLRIFTASLADVFEDHPVVEQVRARIWRETIPALSAIRLPDGRPAAVLLLLTKRAHIAAPWYAAHGCPDVVWPGVTVEDQQRADERIPMMLGLPRLWLSVEPLLEAVDLASTPSRLRLLNTFDGSALYVGDEGGLEYAWSPRKMISWVIVGGESGPNARPMHPDWARSLRDQCVAAGVPYFFKQWGEWAPGEEIEANGTAWTGMYEASPVDGGGVPVHFWPDAPVRETQVALGRTPIPDTRHLSGDTSVLRVGKKAAGRLLDGRTWDEVPTDIAALLVEVRRLRAEVDEAHAETGAVQDAVRATILEHIGAEHSNDIDGAGSDAGPVEFTVMEVRQGLGILQDRLDEVQRERDALRDAAKEAVERSARIRRMEMTEDDRQICAGVHADAAQWLADCLLGALGGAPYAEHQITVTVEAGTVEMVLTTRRKSEPTPHQLRRQAEQERDEARALAEERRVRLMLAGLEGAPEGWRRSGTRTEPGLCWSIGVGSYVDLTHRPHRPQHSRYFEVLSRVGPVRRHQFCGNALDAWTYAKFLRSHIEEHGALPPQETP